MIYFFVVFVLIALSIKEYKYSFLIGFLLLLILSILRAKTVGTDTEMYENIFLGRETFYRDLEPGYVLMMALIKLISKDAQVFIAITSLIIFLPIYFFINKNSSHKVFSLLIFVLLFNFYFSISALRQGIAASFVLTALDNLTSKNIKLFIVWILVATSFHSSAIMILPIGLLFDNVKIGTKIAFVILMISFLIGWFDLLKIRDIVGNLKSAGGGVVDLSKYNTYADYTFDNAKTNINAKLFNMIPSMCLCLILLYLSKKTLSFYTSFFWLGTIFINLFVDIPIAFRVAYYLTFVQIILIPNMFDTFKRPRLLYIVYTIAAFSFFTFQTYKITIYKIKNSTRNDVIPYNTFNEK